MTEKFDLSKERRDLYRASAKKPAVVEVPKFKYLMVDGAGHPKKAAGFQPAMEAIFSVAYTLKFAAKPDGKDFKVMAPEGIWWMEGDCEFDVKRPDDWRWRVLSPVPDFVDAAAMRKAKAELKKKEKGGPSLSELRLKAWKEGKVIQMLHVGPYQEAGPTVERMMEFAAAEGLKPHGRYHEIYLSDPRRTAPEKLKTILRHPVK